MVDSGDRRDILLILLLGVTTLGLVLLATGARRWPDAYALLSIPIRLETVIYELPSMMADLLYVDAYELIRVWELRSDELTYPEELS